VYPIVTAVIAIDIAAERQAAAARYRLAPHRGRR
jgi:hypothetical protein